MQSWQIAVITAIASVLASSGFWTYMTKRFDKNSLHTKMLLGLAHDRIMELGMVYIQRGSISRDEYENLHDYMYVPYKAMGGNGSAERIMQEVSRLPITNAPPTWPEVERRKNGCYSKQSGHDCNGGCGQMKGEN